MGEQDGGASGWRYQAITSGMERLKLLVEPLAAASSDWLDLHGMQEVRGSNPLSSTFGML